MKHACHELGLVGALGAIGQTKLERSIYTVETAFFFFDEACLSRTRFRSRLETGLR
jgi:hypothetical protein